jgi:hypothetical protein
LIRVSPRAFRLLAISYAVKTAVVGAVWLLAPELPRQALELLQSPFATTPEP